MQPQSACGKHRKKQASEDEDDSAAIASLLSTSGSAYSVFLSALRAPANKQALLQQEARLGEPVPVHLGPAKNLANAAEPKGKPKGAIANAATAAGGPELASRSDDGSSVPLPRPRPKIVRTTAAPSTAASATTAQTTAAHATPRPAAAKADPKTDPKTDAKKK